jgi:hypothetical protein
MIPLTLFVVAVLWCLLAWLHWRKYKRDTILASGAEFDRLGDLVGLERRSYWRGMRLETDYSFRERIRKVWQCVPARDTGTE